MHVPLRGRQFATSAGQPTAAHAGTSCVLGLRFAGRSDKAVADAVHMPGAESEAECELDAGGA